MALDDKEIFTLLSEAQKDLREADSKMREELLAYFREAHKINSDTLKDVGQQLGEIQKTIRNVAQQQDEKLETHVSEINKTVRTLSDAHDAKLATHDSEDKANFKEVHNRITRAMWYIAITVGVAGGILGFLQILKYVETLK